MAIYSAGCERGGLAGTASGHHGTQREASSSRCLHDEMLFVSLGGFGGGVGVLRGSDERRRSRSKYELALTALLAVLFVMLRLVSLSFSSAQTPFFSAQVQLRSFRFRSVPFGFARFQFRAVPPARFRSVLFLSFRFRSVSLLSFPFKPFLFRSAPLN